MTLGDAAPVAAPGSLYWWLLFGGSAGAVLTFVLSAVLYRAYCRWTSLKLETGSFLVGLAGIPSMFAGLWGAVVTLDDAPEGPPAGTGDSLLLLVAALGAGAGLVGVLVSIRTADPPRRSVVDTFQPVPVFAVVAMAAVAIVTAVLAALGAAGVLHLSVVQTLAWAYLGVAGLCVAGLVLVALLWTLAAIFGA